MRLFVLLKHGAHGNWQHKLDMRIKKLSSGCRIRSHMEIGFPLSGIGGSEGIYKPEHDGMCGLRRKVARGLKERVDGRRFQK